MDGFKIICNKCKKEVELRPIKQRDGFDVYADYHDENFKSRSFDGIEIFEMSSYQLVIKCDCEKEGE